MLGLGLIQLFIFKARQDLTFITLTSFTISWHAVNQRMLVVANQITYVKGYKTWG